MDEKIDPVKEVVREYLRARAELNAVRQKFFSYMSKKHDRKAKAFAAALRDYRNIQVKLLQTLASLGVRSSDDNLVKILSDLPDVNCDISDCKCAYHAAIKKITEESK